MCLKSTCFNLDQKFSWRTAYLSSCPVGKWEDKFILAWESTLPGKLYVFFEPYLSSLRNLEISPVFLMLSQLKLSNFQSVVYFVAICIFAITTVCDYFHPIQRNFRQLWMPWSVWEQSYVFTRQLQMARKGFFSLGRLSRAGLSEIV